mmetsp:Transcript_89723/g.175578  ORF Transcript_89723/g.175578 Transcript_89723/m.175578 type:complete len:379 (-) Transcript_89723:226-1362(-)
MSRALLLLPVDGDDHVAALRHAIIFRADQCLSDDRVRALEGGRQHRNNAAHDAELPRRSVARGDCENGRAGPVLGDHAGRGASLRQNDDERTARVDGGLDGRRANRLHAADGVALPQRSQADVQIQRIVLDHGFRLLADSAHDGHSVQGESAGSRFAGEHHAIRAVQDRVRHIAGLGASRPGQIDHGLQHLRGRDHRLPHHVAPRDHHLLRQEHLLRRDLHAQVAPGNHDAVAGLHDGVEILQALLVLDLRDDLDAAPAQAEGIADELHIVGALYEGGRDKVDALRDAEFDEILFVFVLQHRQVHLHAGQVAVLALAELAIVHHLRDHEVLAALLHLQGQGAVGHQNRVPWLHRRRKLVVRQRDAGVVALEAVVRHEL